MAYNKVEQQVLEIAEPIAAALSMSVWDVEFKKEGSEYFLRVFIDKDGGVSIDDCETVSRTLSDILDERDPIEQAYYLEVCSAGLDRLLKRERDFLQFIGHNVDIKLYAPLNGIKEFTARLAQFKNNMITVEYENKSLEIPKDKTASVRLSVEF